MKVEFNHDEMHYVPGRVLMDIMSKAKELQEELNKHIRVRK